MDQTIKKKRDPFKNVKYIAYCMSQIPAGGMTLNDFVRYAKFQLAIRTKRLMKDPIWDLYTQEELLAEYFAHQFESNEKFVNEFELELQGFKGGSIEEFDQWASKNILEEDRKTRTKVENLEDKISFNPDTDLLGAE